MSFLYGLNRNFYLNSPVMDPHKEPTLQLAQELQEPMKTASKIITKIEPINFLIFWIFLVRFFHTPSKIDLNGA